MASFADATLCFMVSIWLFIMIILLIAKNDVLQLKSFRICLLTIDSIRENASIAWSVGIEDYIWLVYSNIYRRT